MRFSDLKKKLLLLVGVIAAFALLGSMMLPSISEKMGLNEGLCVAGGYYEYAYEERRAAAEMVMDFWRPIIEAKCEEEYFIDDPQYDKCVEDKLKWLTEWYDDQMRIAYEEEELGIRN